LVLWSEVDPLLLADEVANLWEQKVASLLSQPKRGGGEVLLKLFRCGFFLLWHRSLNCKVGKDSLYRLHRNNWALPAQAPVVGRLKGPILRALPSRAPYFHNGSADSLSDVVDFYDKRFHIGLTPREKEDLIAFLSTL
jgi:hypothetical protein